MTTIKKDISLPNSTSEMFALVTDLEKYPDFISWCKQIVVHSRTPTQIRATGMITKFGKDVQFSFIYTLYPNSMIQIHLLNTGPFKSFSALWRFTDTAQGSKLTLELEYELSNTFIRWVLTPIIKNEVSNVLKDFSNRAKVVY